MRAASLPGWRRGCLGNPPGHRTARQNWPLAGGTRDAAKPAGLPPPHRRPTAAPARGGHVTRENGLQRPLLPWQRSPRFGPARAGPPARGWRRKSPRGDVRRRQRAPSGAACWAAGGGVGAAPAERGRAGPGWTAARRCHREGSRQDKAAAPGRRPPARPASAARPRTCLRPAAAVSERGFDAGGGRCRSPGAARCPPQGRARGPPAVQPRGCRGRYGTGFWCVPSLFLPYPRPRWKFCGARCRPWFCFMPSRSCAGDCG